jgi:hypothetical protein
MGLPEPTTVNATDRAQLAPAASVTMLLEHCTVGAVLTATQRCVAMHVKLVPPTVPVARMTSVPSVPLLV